MLLLLLFFFFFFFFFSLFYSYLHTMQVFLSLHNMQVFLCKSFLVFLFYAYLHTIRDYAMHSRVYQAPLDRPRKFVVSFVKITIIREECHKTPPFFVFHL